MLGGGELEPIVHHGVLREGVEPVVRSPDLVEEDPIVLVLQDRLDLLFGRFLLDLSNGKILFARDVALVLPSMGPLCIPAPTLAPALMLLLGRMPVLVPPAAPTSTLVPTAYSAMLGTVESAELVQRVGWNASMKHSAVPDLLRPLGRLQSRGIDQCRSAGPLVCEFPGVGDGRVAARWWAGIRSHRWGGGGEIVILPTIDARIKYREFQAVDRKIVAVPAGDATLRS